MSNAVMDHDAASIQRPKSRKGCLFAGIAGGCLVTILVCGGLVGAGVFGVMGLIKSSDAYTESLASAKQNEQVQAALGEPIEPGFFVKGKINLDNDAGDADINYSISGPDGTATVVVSGSKANGQWKYQEMSVTLDADGTSIDLLKE